MVRLAILSLVVGFTFTNAIGADQTGEDFFENKIRPLFVNRCFRCHGPESKKRGGLSLDSRKALLEGGDSGPAIVPGKPEKSLLVQSVRSTGDRRMPPKEGLPEEEIAILTMWVRLGAPWPEPKSIATNAFWAFQPLRQPPLPTTQHTVGTEIDRFVQASLEAQGLDGVARADKPTLLRRITYDLHGLPPTPDEIDAFLADTSPDAFAAVVDRLLASPRFGQRWGRHWLDVARFAESAGQSRNLSYRFAWRYRNWVIDALNADLPYNRFVLEQIAGDLLPSESQEQADRQNMATGFLLVGPKLLNENNTSLTYRMGVVDDQIDTIFRSVLGMTVGCARCHDHKYDPIPTRDYYALAGIFRSTENLCGVESNNNTIDNGLYPLGEEGAKLLAEVKAKKEAFEKVNAEFVKARKADQAAEAMVRQAKKKGVPEAELKALEAEATEAKTAFRKVASLRARAKRAIPEPPPSAMAVREGTKIADSELFLNGDVGKPKGTVPRGTLNVLTAVCQPEPIPAKASGRLQLARWLIDARNPLTPRVMVNRIWQHLFGAGLVQTVDNFGALGQRPSHPALLDHLALRFTQSGWSIKQMIRTIVLSDAYQRSSQHDDKAYARDPDNRLVWRMNRRRIEGEAIRDAMLAIADRLDGVHLQGSQVGDLGLFEMQPKYQIDLRASYSKVAYRSVYLPVMRAGLSEMMRVFDAPDSSLVVGRRDVTTVAPQALFLMNDAFVLDLAQTTADRVLERDSTERIAFAFRLVLGREPSERERNRIESYLRENGDDTQTTWADVCHALLASAEFRTLY